MMKHHRRIHPTNYPILDKFETDHPAVRALQLHAETRDVCVGKEIEWPQLGNQAIDQEWFSMIDQRTWTFASFAYAFISFDLVLYGWISEEPSRLQPFEEDFLHELPRLREMLNECESAANNERNDEILPLIAKAREFFDAYEQSIVVRIGPLCVDYDDRYVESLWGAGRCERL
jgi:hypothetical protein